VDGRSRQIADTFNDIIELSDKTTKEVEACQPRGRQRGQDKPARAVPAASGSWLRLVEFHHLLIDDMAPPNQRDGAR